VTQRVLALVLRDLSVEVARRVVPRLGQRPLALVSRGPRGPRRGKGRAGTGGVVRVVAACAEARARGVRAGLTGAQALAAAPDLELHEHAPEADAAALQGLARVAAHAFGPRVAALAAGADAWPALVVDMAGTARLLGPEEELPARACQTLLALGHRARAAIAGTPLAALALAAWGARPGLVVGSSPAKELRAALGRLPPRALPLPAPALVALQRLGVATIAGLLALPRADLAPRLGEEVLALLDRALGERDDPIVPTPLPDLIEEAIEIDLAEGGAERLADVAVALELLATRIAARLDAEGRGALALELEVTLDRRMGEAQRPPGRHALQLAAPVGQARGLVRALEPWLERLDLGPRPVRALRLRVPETARVVPRQGDLFDPDAHREALEERLAALVARLEGRLGARRVLRPRVVADHRPELAHAVVPASAPARGPHEPPPPGPRPTRLLPRPRPLAVETDLDGTPQQVDGRAVTRQAGPERIEAGFWDDAEVRRDYWVVVLDDGRALWVFRDLDRGGWAVHGLFD
jgi:protein ImuB